MSRNVARMGWKVAIAAAITLACTPVHAAQHQSATERTTGKALPASTSTAGARELTTFAAHSIHTSDVGNQTTYYGAPYYTVGWYIYYPTETLQEQIDADWDYYRRYWGVSPYGPLVCTYSFTPTGEGVMTGNFGGINWHGQCHGGNEIAGTAYSYNPGKNNGNPGGCCSAGHPAQ